MNLWNNPFYTLKAHIDDDRQTLVELADEQSLVEDADACMEARSILTNPRKRLTAELSWIIDWDKKLTYEYLDKLKNVQSREDLIAMDTGRFAYGLSIANIISAVLSENQLSNGKNIQDIIWDLVLTFETIDPEIELETINLARSKANFPLLEDESLIEKELLEIKKIYLSSIKRSLDKLDSIEIVKILSKIVDMQKSERQEELILVDDLIDAYEVETQIVLGKEKSKIELLVGDALKKLESPNSSEMIKVYIDDIKIVLKNWGFLTYPIQKSFALRGLSHDASEEVMYKVRKLSLKINEKGLPVSIIKEINDVLIKVFSELPEAKERLEKDDKQIAELQEEEQFKPLINSLLELFDGYAEKFKKQPVVIYERALKMFSEAETILGKLEAAKASQAILDEQHERLAKFAFAIANILARGFQWSSCQVIAERAMKHARTEDVKKNLRDMVAIAKEQNRRYGSVEPITELPTLFSFFIGTGLYGHADVDRVSQSYVVTLCIHVLGIPLIPIRRYRVQDTENGFHFLGTYRLADWQKTYLIWVVAAVALYIWLKD